MSETKAIDPGPVYRLLAAGEQLRVGDECLIGGTWCPAVTIGFVIPARWVVHVRRKARPDAHCHGFRAMDAGEVVTLCGLHQHHSAPYVGEDVSPGSLWGCVAPWAGDPRCAPKAPEAPLSIAEVRAALPWTSPTPPRGWEAVPRGVMMVPGRDIHITGMCHPPTVEFATDSAPEDYGPVGGMRGAFAWEAGITPGVTESAEDRYQRRLDAMLGAMPAWSLPRRGKKAQRRAACRREADFSGAPEGCSLLP